MVGPETVLTREQTKLCTLRESGKFGVDASELGWPPGHWPKSLGAEAGVGTSEPFRLDHVEKKEGEILWVDYIQWGVGGIRLRVFND